MCLSWLCLEGAISVQLSRCGLDSTVRLRLVSPLPPMPRARALTMERWALYASALLERRNKPSRKGKMRTRGNHGQIDVRAAGACRGAQCNVGSLTFPRRDRGRGHASVREPMVRAGAMDVTSGRSNPECSGGIPVKIQRGRDRRPHRTREPWSDVGTHDVGTRYVSWSTASRKALCGHAKP